MRTTLFVAGLVMASLLAIWPLVDPRMALPLVGPDVEPICADVMQRRPADLSWVAPDRDDRIRGRAVAVVTIGELAFHPGALVRVRGVLHAQFEWVVLYPSLASMGDLPPQAPWVALDSLWPNDPYWNTKGPSISDRCVVIEGVYRSGPDRPSACSADRSMFFASTSGRSPIARSSRRRRYLRSRRRHRRSAYQSQKSTTRTLRDTGMAADDNDTSVHGLCANAANQEFESTA